MSKKEYCYLAPDFPQEGYIGGVFITQVGKNSHLWLYPMQEIYRSRETLAMSVRQFIKELGEQFPEGSLPNTGILIPCRLIGTHAFKKEHWVKPLTHYDDFERQKSFVSVYDKPEIFQVMANPFLDNKTNEWKVFNFLPLPLHSNPELIEQFLKTTDLNVDDRANSVGIYHLQRPYKINWNTMESEIVSHSVVSHK